MKLSRRIVLQSGSALSLSLATGRATAQQTETKTGFLLLEGLDRLARPSDAEDILQIFFKRGIPLCIGIENTDEDDPSQDGRLSAFLRSIGEAALREPGLAELTPVFSPSASDQRYFQLRAACTLRRQLAMSSLEDVIGEKTARIVTVLDRTESNTIDPYAFRAAGFRILIREAPQEGGKPELGTVASSPDWGLLTLEGMTAVSVFDNADEGLAGFLRKSGSQLLKISFADAEAKSDRDALNAAETWADGLREAIWSGEIFMTRPADHLLQGNPGASKWIALLLDQREGVTDGMAAFMKDLEGLEFPYSLLMSRTEAPASSVHHCVLNSTDKLESAPECVYVENGEPLSVGALSRIIVRSPKSPNAWTGQRSDARFQIALAAPGSGSFAARHDADPMTDQVELVSPQQVETGFHRRVLLRHLRQLRSDGRAHFYSVQGFVNQILAPETALLRLWSVRKRFAREPLEETQLDPSQAAEMRRDARLAWRYIERFTNLRTGICAGTATSQSKNQGVTLWDLASQLFGIMSARRIGLIKKDDAAQRCESLVSNLPTESFEELRLPPSVFQADTLQMARRGYDACDTGRFLLALDALRRSGLVEEARLRTVLDQWDLEATVKNGLVFSYSQGRWVDESLSHCTPYTAPGFAAGGIDIRSAYPSFSETGNGDDRMRLLHQAAFLGHYGAEPLLLEAVERGQTPESRFLSDVLFDAQLSWFEETGSLRSVSESPLDMEPWFIYQGLRVDRTGEDAWVIDARSGAPKYQTTAFRKRAEVISTKSAYLWAAAYPHSYSDRLVALAREKARIDDLGFSAGVYANTLKPMEGYSDLNTNGIILTAIAKLLSE